VKTVLVISLVLLLLALDWAALNDIVQGEPDVYGEYAMLVFSVVVFAVLAFFKLRGRDKGTTAV
jgi:hypothetical protein